MILKKIITNKITTEVRLDPIDEKIEPISFSTHIGKQTPEQFLESEKMFSKVALGRHDDIAILQNEILNEYK